MMEGDGRDYFETLNFWNSSAVTWRTQRKPQKSVEKHASVSPVRSPWRAVARHWSGLDFQLPPRITRLTSFPGLGGP